jgi:acetamidase/formamidase
MIGCQDIPNVTRPGSDVTVHELASAQENIHYEWDSSLAPRLVIEPGDEVVIDTRSGEDDQLRPGDAPSAIDAVDWDRLHALTGPIYIKRAKPGSTLVVTVLDARPAAWGLIMQRPGAGLLRGFETYLRFFDLEGGRVIFAPGVSVELHPFLGIMGVAPPQ